MVRVLWLFYLTISDCIIVRLKAAPELLRYISFMIQPFLLQILYEGWGFRPQEFCTVILGYQLGGMAWTCAYNLKVVLGPCAQCWPCEVSDLNSPPLRYHLTEVLYNSTFSMIIC